MSDAPAKPLALVIDDEVQIRRLLRLVLEAEGYRVADAATGQAGLVEAAQHPPDVVLLDLGLPDLGGVAVLRRLREWSPAPVLVLSVRDQDDVKVAALDAGADDYVTKPFSTPELLARLRAVRRRNEPPAAEAVFTAGPLEVDRAARRVRVAGREVHLTPTEYALLRALCRHPGRVLAHRPLLTEVSGPNAAEQTHYLRVHLANLREKLGPAGTLVRTEPGIGYRLLEESPRATPAAA
ncbi:MAG: response regulator [Limisphaerales bacterium]